MEPTLDTTTLEVMAETTDAEFVGELIDTFMTDTPQLIAQLRQSLSANNADVFRRAAHSLKSNGASLGALALAALAKDLEQLGKAGTIVDTGASIATLAAEYEQVVLALKAWQGSSG